MAGGDQHALEEALALSEIARSVTIATPIPALPAEDELARALDQADNLHVETGLKLQEILGEGGMVVGARFTDRNGEERVIESAGIFLYLRGDAPATDFLLGAVDLDEDGYIITDELMQTSVPGVFAAGDVRKKTVRQQCVAAAEGAIAALAAERFVRGGQLRWDRG